MPDKPSLITEDLATLVPMVRAVLAGRYKMPWKTLFFMVLCLVYFVSPIDFVPDLLPVLGFADDGAFILFVLVLLHQDLAAFRAAQTQAAPKRETSIEAEVVKEDKEGEK